MHTLLACELPQPDINALPKIHPPKSICASFFDIRSPLLIPPLQMRESSPGLLQSHTLTMLCFGHFWGHHATYIHILDTYPHPTYNHYLPNTDLTHWPKKQFLSPSRPPFTGLLFPWKRPMSKLYTHTHANVTPKDEHSAILAVNRNIKSVCDTVLS